MENQTSTLRRVLARVGSVVGTTGLLLPAIATGAAVSYVMAQYVPTVYDPASVQTAAASEAAAPAAELKSVDTSNVEKESAQPTSGANITAADYALDSSTFKDGVYTGSGTGYRGTITVQVTISDGKIANIEVLSSSDDEAYFSRATAVISSVIASQSTSVDVVSGATYSSKGILMAIKNALDQASGGSVEALQEAVAPAVSSSAGISGGGTSHANLSPVVAQNGYADGSYVGSGQGYNGTVQLRVTFAGGKISNIEMLSNVDDAAYFGRAWASIPSQVIASQSTSVDVVSGATYSSEGILAAVQDAMRQAAAAAGQGTSAGDVDDTDEDEDDEDVVIPANDIDDDEDDDADEDGTGYEDGSYTGYALCENMKSPDEFDPYYVAVTVEIEDGKVAQIEDVYGTDKAPTLTDALSLSFNTDNQRYLDWAKSGRTLRGVTHKGVVEQLEKGKDPEDVDAVSGATYSSKAIAQAYANALEQSEKAYQEAHAKSDADADSDEDEDLDADDEDARDDADSDEDDDNDLVLASLEIEDEDDDE